MPLPTMTVPPTAPAISDDSVTFNTRAFACWAWMATHVSEQTLWAANLPSVVTGTDYTGTSTTSVAVGTGAKSFTTQTGRYWQIGQSIRVASTATPANFMDGQVTAYNSGTGAIDVNVTTIGGTGTFAAWTLSLAVSGSGSFATLTGTETLTNKTLTAPTITTITNSGTITLPTGTRTLVARDTTDTLTNKTIDTAGSNTIKVNGNSFAATAGTATITFFNTNDTVVGRATTDTLTNKTLTSPTINGGTMATATIQANNTLDDTGTIGASSPGFRGLPASGQTQGSLITLALSNAGKSVANTLGGWTIPANATAAFPVWTTITLYNDSASGQTVAITTDTLRLHGSATTGTRTVAQRGFCTLVKVNTTEWVATGDVS